MVTWHELHSIGCPCTRQASHILSLPVLAVERQRIVSIVKRIFGAYSVVMAAVVGVLFFLTPVYDDGSTGYPAWAVVNWFMAPTVLTALAASFVWKLGLNRGEAADGDLRRSLEVNALFYSALVLALWYLSNWFGDLVGREVPLLWSFIDPLYVAVTGACGVRLWRSGSA